MSYTKKWWEGKFILSTFTSVVRGDDIEKIVSLLHEAGLNTIECNTPLEYSSNDPTREEVIRLLKACEKNDMKFFLTDHQRMTGVKEPSLDAIKSIIDDYSSYPALGGYYVWDEPFIDEFGIVKKMYDMIRSMDKERLPLNAMLPSNGPYHHPDAYREFARQYVEEIDPSVLSFDNYSVFNNDNDPENPLRIDQDVYRDLAVWSEISKETGKPFWMYVTACRWLQKAKPSRATLSIQVYTAIAYGAKGIQYFESKGFTGGRVDFLDAPINQDGTKGTSYEIFKSFNSEINAKAPWLGQMAFDKLMHTAPVPEDIEEFTPGYKGLVGASKNLIISFHNGSDSEVYLVIVNKDVNYAQDVYLEFSKTTNLEQLPEMTKLQGKENKIWFTLAPGGGKLFRLCQ